MLELVVDNTPRRDSNGRQSWAVGAFVNVGFLRGLRVVEHVASPGNYRPDGYVLARGEQLYAFVPHCGGVQKARNIEDAREIIRA